MNSRYESDQINDQYTTIVRSKTAEIVLNRPKTTCS
jgi:hypothetical protein